MAVKDPHVAELLRHNEMMRNVVSELRAALTAKEHEVARLRVLVHPCGHGSDRYDEAES